MLEKPIENRPVPPAANPFQPASETPARPRAGRQNTPVVVALTEELSLLEALAGAVGEGEGFTAAPTLERFADLLVVSGADLALIDCALLDGAPALFFSRIHQQFPKLTLLAVGDSAQQQQLEPQLADGTVLRFAHRPLSAQRLRLFFETARRHREGLQALAGIAAGADTTVTTRIIAPSTARGSSRPWLLILTLGALLGGAVWWWWPGATETDSAAPAEASVAAPAADASEQAPAIAAAPAESGSAPAAADTEVQHWVELAGERMQEGALIAPANDNAQSYISAAAARAPQNPAVRAAAHELGERLISATRSALASGDLNSAARWLAAARDYRVGASTLAQLDAAIADARAAAAANGQPAAAAPASAPASGGTP